MHERLGIAINLWLLGALPEAETELRRLEDLDEMLSDAVAFRRFALAGVLTDRGALTEARHEAERMVEIGRAWQLFPVEGRGLWALAEVLRRKEDLAAAETADGCISAPFRTERTTIGSLCLDPDLQVPPAARPLLPALLKQAAGLVLHVSMIQRRLSLPEVTLARLIFVRVVV